MIPSFHRPGIIRNQNANGNTDDWMGINQSGPNASFLWADSAARILRPRRIDGHDPSTFPDLKPDSTGKIQYDVDNDGDGNPDSVWVDLGYPARRDASGRLYKPLYAFMVIGLNGRIPLNTAGQPGVPEHGGVRRRQLHPVRRDGERDVDDRHSVPSRRGDAAHVSGLRRPGEHAAPG